MSSKAITDKPEASRPADSWEPSRETAPSETRLDEPGIGRVVGFIGLMCLALGGTALLLHRAGVARGIGPVWGSIFAIAGVACLLFHAFCDGDVQVRRIYGLVGFLWLAVGILVTLLPFPKASGDLFLPYGYACGILALFFLLPFSRHETDSVWRQYILYTLGGGGAALALVGLIGGAISSAFLAPYGMLLALLGLAYLWAFLSIEGTANERGYRIASAVGLVGALALLWGLGRTILPQLFHAWGWTSGRPEPYFMPHGLLFVLAGALYLLLAVALLSERRIVVLTRRELEAYFYSPIAYLALLMVTGIGWVQYSWFFIGSLAQDARTGGVLLEPIVTRMLLAWGPILSIIIVVPILTMRLFSEERRTGTLEVLLTAPVDEFSIVLSKFLAAWMFFMLLWVPWSLLLLGLRLEIDQPIEYRPLVNFYIVLGCAGAGFISYGMFFSALTRNQLIAAILTAVVMMMYLMAFILVRFVIQPEPAGVAQRFWIPVYTHVSFIELMITSLQNGMLNLQYLIYHLSAAVFGLFLTVKVLEARKWL